LAFGLKRLALRALQNTAFANIDSLEHHAVYVSDSMRPQQVLWTP
jgi:hypothetical protein